MPSPSARDANWIDGLRGIASLFVVIGHLCTSFVPYLHSPTTPDGPTLFQLPFFRLCVSGRTSVAIFFIVTGYVNAIGPLSKIAAGDMNAAFTSLSRSALTRTGKLVLPAAVATLISWTLSQFGAYQMTEFVDAQWIKQGHRPPATTWCEAGKTLFKAQVGTWTGVWDENYDGTQWTLILFLEGSMIVYLTIFSTLLVQRRARMAAFAALWAYGWLSARNTLKTMNIAIGMSLASVSSSQGKFAKPSLPGPLPILMMVTGAFLAGFPQDNPETYPWSEWMRKVMFAITPPDADLRRYWDSLGATLIFTGICFSSTARCILSSRYCNFLGKVSFPVYLLHNQLIKTVLTWLVFGPSWWAGREKDQFGNYLPLARGGTVWVSFGCGVFFFVLYRLAMWWVHYLDPLIARVNKWLVNWAYDVDDGMEKVPNLLG